MATQQNHDEWLTPKELAERLKISVSAIHQYKCSTAELKRYRVGRLLRFKLSEIQAFERKIEDDASR